MYLTSKDDPESPTYFCRGILKSHSTSTYINRHDIGYRFAFTLVNSVGGATSAALSLAPPWLTSTSIDVPLPNIVPTFQEHSRLVELSIEGALQSQPWNSMDHTTTLPCLTLRSNQRSRHSIPYESNYGKWIEVWRRYDESSNNQKGKHWLIPP